MKVVGSRVDALTVAYRVKLDPAFVAQLRARAEVAKEHGRAAFEFGVRVPDDDGDGTTTSKGRHKVGPLRLRWADEVSRTRREAKVWGELRYSRADRCWRIINQPYFRMQVVLNAPGGGHRRDCATCAGTSMLGTEACPACGGEGSEEEPGWTLEVVWYAQTLADWGLERTLAESAALASNVGEVLETRLRRLDLCADVAGWDVDEDDVIDRLVKRPHAEWRRWSNTLDEVPPPSGVRRSREERDADATAIYGRGVMQARRVTGVVVGRGPLMCRLYDKRAELERDAERREAEEDRWTEGGWDGIAPVARVEFQIRGVALTEFGLRDPDAVLEPVTRVEEYLDARGKLRRRTVVTGHRCLTARLDDGREVQATVVHRLDDLWRACLSWVRLIVPETTRSGKDKPACRLQDDPRWALLRALRFTDVASPRPIRRYRPRAAASSAQALGVSISQAGRDGRLQALPERRDAYPNNEHGETILRSQLLALKLAEAERIAAYLLEKFEGPAGALEHFAIRVNAARARFRRGVESESFEPLAESPAPMLAAG